MTNILRMSNIFIDGLFCIVNNSLTLAVTDVTHFKEVAAIELHGVR